MSAAALQKDAAIARWRRALPEALFDLPVFLLWERRAKLGKPGKFDKIPFYANGRQRNGVNGCAEDRAQLSDLGDTLVAYQRGRRDGIGVALLNDAPFWALDLDDCIDQAGTLSALAQRAVASGTYTECSPSGSGVRALFSGKAGADKKNHAAGVEVFDSRGFVTLTGDQLGGESMLACPPDLLAEILRIVFASDKARSRDQGYSDAPAENSELVRSVRLPLPVWRRLAEPYSHGCDRSAVAFSIALQLKRLGLTREQTLEIMTFRDSDVLVPALERRRGDIEGARDWMWTYVVRPAFESGGARGG